MASTYLNITCGILTIICIVMINYETPIMEARVQETAGRVVSVSIVYRGVLTRMVFIPQE